LDKNYVEGAEYEVLKGAQNILSKSTDITLLIEIHNLSAGNIIRTYTRVSWFIQFQNRI
jgi:Methyltransferase FkbM domain